MSKSKIDANPQALSGVKIVDLTRAIAGPICTMILADMGAEVIKVVEPGKEDENQENPPWWNALRLFDRNKKSITLNLRSDKGKDILRRLIKWGDVLVENYRPGIMQRMGFGYPVVREINPRTVMTSISGYGQTGPYANRAGLDGVGQAMGGLMSTMGPANSPPIMPGAVVSDISTGVFGALGTMLALYRCKSTGLGQHVEATLMESTVFLMSLNLGMYASGPPTEKEELKRMPGAGTFQTKDGTYLVIMAELAQHFPILAHIIGRDDLATAPGYKTRAERTKHADEIYDLIQAWVGSHTINEVEATIDKAGIPFGRVQTVEDVLKDPHLIGRGRFVNLDVYGQVKSVFGPYPILSDTPGSIRTPYPRSGQHNDEVYRGLLGFSQDELAILKRGGVI